ncbi:hypothetical protein [Lachnobacterium bovis]|uniref:N-(5'phosphoribosyl)anthranilate (PRA) isomerase n=1 Tax=Lachnobacterium bovis TaxID=140626 RepID=A0A1H9S0I8_9FIRM|nr:hypothetical protein [Lachnobacterium bovis]SER77853.1 N-(5'phosphoribosyl)anthranilate (PRA) isomerase [Lachnobacterium bovis]
MKEILNQYASVLIVVIVALCCIGLFCGKFQNKSISAVTKEFMQEKIKKTKVHQDEQGNQKFEKFMQRQRPIIKYTNKIKLYEKKQYKIDELFIAKDQDGNKLDIKIINAYQEETKDNNILIQGKLIYFSKAGEYVFILQSKDSYNKKTVSKILLPVQSVLER